MGWMAYAMLEAAKAAEIARLREELAAQKALGNLLGAKVERLTAAIRAALKTSHDAWQFANGHVVPQWSVVLAEAIGASEQNEPKKPTSLWPHQGTD